MIANFIIIRYRLYRSNFKTGAEEMKLDLSRSYMIGDMLTDIEAAARAGVKSILIRSGVVIHRNNFRVSSPKDSLVESPRTGSPRTGSPRTGSPRTGSPSVCLTPFAGFFRTGNREHNAHQIKRRGWCDAYRENNSV